jgi:hypothetical protein
MSILPSGWYITSLAQRLGLVSGIRSLQGDALRPSKLAPWQDEIRGSDVSFLAAARFLYGFSVCEGTSTMSDQAFTLDAVLLALVRATNSMTEAADDVEGVGLVLFVGGCVVSGKLIPNWLWFRKVENQLREQENHENKAASGLRELFGFFGQEMISLREDTVKIFEVIDKVPEKARDALAAADRTEFIHLEEARVFQPGHPGMPGNGMLWRGRLEDIAGWSLGLFMP